MIPLNENLVRNFTYIENLAVLEHDFHKNKIPAEDPFDPEQFKSTADLVNSLLKNHLANTKTRGLKLTDPTILLEKAMKLMGSESSTVAKFDAKKLESILELYMSTGIPVQSTGYMGRQFSSPLPLSGITDFVSSIINQPSSFYEAAQLPNVVEQIVADKFYNLIGWNNHDPAMVTTSGGSLANMTAILAARNNAFPEIWKKGVMGIDKNLLPAIAVSEDVHYSITRAVGILGIGEDQVIKLPTNKKKQICINQVETVLDEAAAKGLKVFCLVASAGSTSIGAIDPINELGDITRKRNIWLHVDGAHGGGFLMSNKLKHKLNGIHKVDSFIIDAHKMLFVPGTCTLLFYKDKQKAKGAFQQKASYVFEKNEDIYTKYDSAEKNFECTKRPMIMNLWVPWAMYGKSVYSNKLEYLYQLTQKAYRTILIQKDFIAHHQPESNIFCFSYIPENLPKILNFDFQLAIRNVLKEEGKFFISKVEIDGNTVLRVVFMNHNIKIEKFEQLLDEIRNIGQKIIKNWTKNN
jgi:L-2,4-diaminobutyrate decarboxylase